MMGFAEIPGRIEVAVREDAEEDDVFDAILILYSELDEGEYVDGLTWSFDGTIPDLNALLERMEGEMGILTDIVESVTWSCSVGREGSEVEVTAEYSERGLNFSVRSPAVEPVEAFYPARELLKQLFLTRPELHSELEDCLP